MVFFRHLFVFILPEFLGDCQCCFCCFLSTVWIRHEYGGIGMKFKSLFGFIVLAMLPAGAGAAVGDSVCDSLSQCLDDCTRGYCCAAGYTGIILSCPDNWNLTTSTSGEKQCSRAATTESSAGGDYIQYYTSCDPTETTGQCYIHLTSVSGPGSVCTMCRQIAPGGGTVATSN